jgi:polar amino acid transport system substrate-binding protein
VQGNGEVPSVRAALTALAVLLALASPQARGCVMTVRYQNTDAPFSMVNAGGEVVGITPDLIREIFARMECTARFVELPWTRALKDLEAGSLDVLPDSSYVAERTRYARFSDEFSDDANVLYIRRNDAGRWSLQSLEDLIDNRIRLGVEVDYIYSPEYKQRLADPRFRELVQMLPKREYLWKMLAAGRVDGILIPKQTGAWELKHSGYADRVVVYDSLTLHDPGFVAFSRRSVPEERVAQFNAALAAIRRDGTYAAILHRYIAE